MHGYPAYRPPIAFSRAQGSTHLTPMHRNDKETRLYPTAKQNHESQRRNKITSLSKASEMETEPKHESQSGEQTTEREHQIKEKAPWRLIQSADIYFAYAVLNDNCSVMPYSAALRRSAFSAITSWSSTSWIAPSMKTGRLYMV